MVGRPFRSTEHIVRFNHAHNRMASPISRAFGEGVDEMMRKKLRVRKSADDVTTLRARNNHHSSLIGIKCSEVFIKRAFGALWVCWCRHE